MLPQARAALEDHLEAEHGDLSDINRLADAVYRAARDDTVTAMRAFTGIEDHLYRADRHLQDAAQVMGRLVAFWRELDGEESA